MVARIPHIGRLHGRFGAVVVGAAVAWGLAGLAAAGCRGDEVGVAAGAGATGAGGNGVDAGLAAEICPKACATAKSCMQARLADVSACETQCAAEISGAGYLIPEIAVQFFEALHDHDADPDCTWTLFGAWRLDPLHPESFHLDLDEPALITECADSLHACYELPVPETQEACFLEYYRYNAVTRASIHDCWTEPCFTQDGNVRADCLCAKQAIGQPWIAVYDEDDACPPP
jgi:hypothetical protein